MILWVSRSKSSIGSRFRIKCRFCKVLLETIISSSSQPVLTNPNVSSLANPTGQGQWAPTRKTSTTYGSAERYSPQGPSGLPEPGVPRSQEVWPRSQSSKKSILAFISKVPGKRLCILQINSKKGHFRPEQFWLPEILRILTYGAKQRAILGLMKVWPPEEISPKFRRKNRRIWERPWTL